MAITTYPDVLASTKNMHRRLKSFGGRATSGPGGKAAHLARLWQVMSAHSSKDNLRWVTVGVHHLFSQHILDVVQICHQGKKNLSGFVRMCRDLSPETLALESWMEEAVYAQRRPPSGECDLGVQQRMPSVNFFSVKFHDFCRNGLPPISVIRHEFPRISVSGNGRPW